MSLAEASEARKARLQAFRKRKSGQDGEAEEQADESIIKHRNFDPKTRTLRKAGHNDEAVRQDTVESSLEGVVAKIIEEDKARRAEELDIHNIAPRRVNWDLKRDLNKKLARLERKTQESIHTLIMQRLAAQKGESDDLVGAMRAQEDARQTAENQSDDEE